MEQLSQREAVLSHFPNISEFVIPMDYFIFLRYKSTLAF